MKLNDEQKDKIVELFHSGRTQKSLADEFGVCASTIRKILMNRGVDTSSHRNVRIDVDEDLTQLLIGSLLGDGCFCLQGKSCKNYSLVIGHGIKQEKYLMYKFNILKKHNLANNIQYRTHEDIRFKTPEYRECKVKSRNHPIFTKVRKLCYDNTGHKRVNEQFVKDIKPLGLAIWYMDDGYVTKSSCIFSTCSFTKEEQEILSKILLEKFDLHFTVGSNDNSMYLHSYDFDRFVKIIKPFVIPEMQYKLIPYNRRVHVKSDELLESCDANQQPSQPLTKLEGSETNS